MHVNVQNVSTVHEHIRYIQLSLKYWVYRYGCIQQRGEPGERPYR